jgi:hypothetical protein
VRGTLGGAGVAGQTTAPSVPQAKIIVPGDSGFCQWRMLCWCERREAGYPSVWPRTRASTKRLGR